MKVRELMAALAVANPELSIVIRVEDTHSETAYARVSHAGVDDIAVIFIDEAVVGETFVLETREEHNVH